MEFISRVLEFLVTMPFALMALMTSVRFEARLQQVERAFLHSRGFAHFLRVAAALLAGRGITGGDGALASLRRRFFVFALAALVAGIGYNVLMARTCWLPGTYVTLPNPSLSFNAVQCRRMPDGSIERIEAVPR